MPIPWTLQRYILREMGKMFLLAAVALTGVVGLGGGVLNMIKLGEVTPDQVVRLMVMLLPLAAALTLPVAALFAATACYGRLSADNEFVACRSSGINLYTLFLPTVIISIFSGAVCFGFTNYLIPRMVRNLNEFVGADVVTLLQRLAKQPGGFSLSRKYRMFTDDIVPDASDPNRVSLFRIAFVEVDEDDWVRFGTARAARLTYDRGDEILRVAAKLEGVEYYDRRLESFSELREQTIASEEFPSPVSHKIKFLNLTELLYFRDHPGEWHEVRKELNDLRAATARLSTLRRIRAELSAQGRTILADGNATIELTGALASQEPTPANIELTGVRVEQRHAGRMRSITAKRATIKTTGDHQLGETGVLVELQDLHSSSGGVTIQAVKEALGPLALPGDIVKDAAALSDADLLAKQGAPEVDPLAPLRAKGRKTWAGTVRKIVGSIHERTALSLSVFVLVILGAALGIVFRGAHVMTAFGLSFIPALLILVTIVTGKQMSNNAGTHSLGLSVIWGGLVLVAVLDVWVMTKVLRR